MREATLAASLVIDFLGYLERHGIADSYIIDAEAGGFELEASRFRGVVAAATAGKIAGDFAQNLI